MPLAAAASTSVKPFANSYATPGWQRAQKRYAAGEAMRSAPRMIEGHLIASETAGASFSQGDRVFHQKFGYGRILRIEGNKLTVDFDKAGEKRVIDSFLEPT